MKNFKLYALSPIALVLLMACGGDGSSTPPVSIPDPDPDPTPDPPPVQLCIGNPCPQPRPMPAQQTLSEDEGVTFIVTDEGQHEAMDVFSAPPGSNHLESVYENMRDMMGNEIVNTLPSTPTNPYNLHPEPLVSEIDATSPTDDLDMVIRSLQASLADGTPLDMDMIQFGIDVLEGNPIDRLYSGIAMLHYKGPEKQKVVEPIEDADGNVVGGNVNVHQIWFDSHIEADTAFINPSLVWEVPWTINYTVDVLNRGHDDFAPSVMYFERNAENGMAMPNVMMDQTFFPMEDKTRTVYEVAMAPGKFYNLTYTWGWRMHPPRVQVSENALKMIEGKTLPQWEIDVFGENPSATEESKMAAIAMIGDLAPAKIMWTMLRELKMGADNAEPLVVELKDAFQDWKDRSKLPRGIERDMDADVTLFYANNTIYGEMSDGNQGTFSKWRQRPQELKVRLYNGDYFQHGYTNVDFGGSRGWQNMFISTVDIGGSGPWFTFGRHHFFPTGGAPGWPRGLISVPPANAADSDINPMATIGTHLIHITYNFEPNRRVRFYQFDPTHHETAVWTVH